MTSAHLSVRHLPLDEGRTIASLVLTVLLSTPSGVIACESAGNDSGHVDTPTGISTAASALPVTRMTDSMNRAIERLHTTAKGDTQTIAFTDNALIEFSRDVLTGEGECAAKVATKDHYSGLGRHPEEPEDEYAQLLALGFGEMTMLSSPAIILSRYSGVPFKIVPSDGDIRIVTDASERIYAFPDIETFDMNDMTTSILSSNSDDVAPLWHQLQRSGEMIIALDSTTAYTYDLVRVPELIGIVEYLCGDGALAREPDWPSILEAERRAAAAVRADWPPR